MLCRDGAGGVMSKHSMYIDASPNGGFQIITVGPEGQIGKALQMSDVALLDFHANITPHVRSAWQRVRNTQNPKATFPNTQ